MSIKCIVCTVYLILKVQSAPFVLHHNNFFYEYVRIDFFSCKTSSTKDTCYLKTLNEEKKLTFLI